MQQFNYIIKDKKGISHQGLIEAPTERAAVAILHDRGYTIIKLEEKKVGFALSSLFQKVGIGPQSQFTRQLATMVTSGLPLTDSLVVLQKQTENEKLRQIIQEITEDIQGGSTFSSALAKHGQTFSVAFINIIKAGEASGTLDKVLLKLADTLEKEREFQGKIKGAMIYPIIITSAMVGVGAIVLIFVVPKLAEVYTGLDIALPLPTRIFMFLGYVASNFWWLILILFVVGIYALRRYRKTPSGGLVVDRILLKIPIFGKLNRDSSLTEFTRTLGALVGAGVPILEALKIAGETATNALHRAAVVRVSTIVEKGATLSTALGNEEMFPAIIPQMVSVGEETGKMDEVLSKVAAFFEMEVDQEVQTLTTALEPIIMIILGIGVALLMISIIMPIYSITQAF